MSKRRTRRRATGPWAGRFRLGMLISFELRRPVAVSAFRQNISCSRDDHFMPIRMYFLSPGRCPQIDQNNSDEKKTIHPSIRRLSATVIPGLRIWPHRARHDGTDESEPVSELKHRWTQCAFSFQHIKRILGMQARGHGVPEWSRGMLTANLGNF